MISLLGSFGSVLTTIGYVILALVVLLLMITIHEFGHYIFGKKLGFKINEFSIGFGKALYSKKLKSGETFSIRLIPLGGYCAFAGEDEDDADPKAFNNQKPWKRLIVQFGGVCFNFVSAIIFSFILLLCFGYDIQRVDVADKNVQPNLYQNDVIRQIDGKSVDFITDSTSNVLVSQYYNNLTEEEKASATERVITEDIYKNYFHPGEELSEEDLSIEKRTCKVFTINFTVDRDGERIENVPVNLYVFENSDETKTLKLGILVSPYAHHFGEALARCVPLTFAFAWKVLVSLWLLITGGLSLADMGGPFTTISTMASYSQQNIANLFVFLPFISANLAVFNFLPFPALDGARMVFTTIEWIRGKPINRDIEARIHLVGIIILFAFMIFVDIYHLFI
ncbi:MAG: RIP metalloprotease RseP [Clostridia bacterium]|nr:RIP metalloprotease RseP [Clostridia bacterium]